MADKARLALSRTRKSQTASTNLFQLRYSGKHKLTHVASRYLGSQYQPIAPKIAHMWVNRDKNTLWWIVSDVSLLSHKKVIRSWCSRRARIAFARAMLERGFDSEGRRLSDDMGSNGRPENLTGTAEIVVNPGCIKEEFPVVQNEMKSIVDALIQGQRNEKRGQSTANRPSVLRREQEEIQADD